MTKPCITVPDYYDIKYAAALMARTNIINLPVTSKDKLVGLITFRDIVKAYLK